MKQPVFSSFLPSGVRASALAAGVCGCVCACVLAFVPDARACAHGQPSAAAAAAAAQNPSPNAQAKTAPQEPVQWLTDEQGRNYRLEPLAKSQAVKIAPDKLRTIWGVPADLVKEDEKFYYIKIYKVGPPPPVVKPRLTPPPPPEPLPRASQRLRFSRYDTGLPTAGQWREGLVLVDINADGQLDIVASPARKTLRPPSIFLQAKGTWSRATGFRFPQKPYDYGDVAAGDLNGDGVLDLALGVHLRGLMALRGSAAGPFEDASTGLPFSIQSQTPAFSSRAIALMDCNADGRLDLVALGEGPRLPTGGAQITTNTGLGLASFVQAADGTWTTKLQEKPGGLFGSSMATADIDGDGRRDVVVAPGGLGDPRLAHRGDGACGWVPEPVDAVRPRSYITAIAAANVDGDARDELIVGYIEFSSDQPIYGADVLSRAADGTWSRRALAREPGRVRIEAIGGGDFDGDGATDVAVVAEKGATRIYLGDGRGGFTREQQVLASPGGCEAASITIGDLDRDGLADLVVGYSQEASISTAGACPNEGAIAAWRSARAGSAPAARPATGRPAPQPSGEKPATGKPATGKPGTAKTP